MFIDPSEDDEDSIDEISNERKSVATFVYVNHKEKLCPEVTDKVDEKGVTLNAVKRTVEEHWTWPEDKDELVNFRGDGFVAGILQFQIKAYFFCALLILVNFN